MAAPKPGSRRGAIKAFIRKNFRKVIIALAILLLLSFLFSKIKIILVVLFFILAASFSTFYFNFLSAPINFELVKLATILVSATYGPVPGLATGLISTVAGKALIGRIDEKLPFSMLAISIVAVLASVFSSAGIATLGIALVFVYNLTMLVMTQVLGGSWAWNIPYEGTNLLFNIFLFSRLAPFLQQLMR